MDEKVQKVLTRFAEVETLLQDPSVTQNPERLKALAKEYSDLEPIKKTHNALVSAEKELHNAKQEFQESDDEELRNLAQEEIATLEKKLEILAKELVLLVTPSNPLDPKNVLMEIRGGAGGDEAALFAADLFRMYMRYAERHSLVVELASSNRTGVGGLKEVIFEIKGNGAYGKLKYESGVHRVQRIPETEKSGRVHTSTVTVVVLPEPEAVDVELKPEDVKIEATTSSGHGGQSVNTTYSAIRLTHFPTGITVSCQDERSQKQNKEKAFQILRARVYAFEMEKKQQADSAARKSQVGTGDRSEKIRTYNIPQDRVTDHRLKQNFPAVQSILDGNLDPILDAFAHADDKS